MSVKNPSQSPRAIKERAALATESLASKCLDCGAVTVFFGRGARSEYYMVHESLWLKANPNDHGKLCIGCLEARIGRRLTAADFIDCPINEIDRSHSDRLNSRLQN